MRLSYLLDSNFLNHVMARTRCFWKIAMLREQGSRVRHGCLAFVRTVGAVNAARTLSLQIESIRALLGARMSRATPSSQAISRRMTRRRK
jgi:hypothetical protein